MVVDTCLGYAILLAVSITGTASLTCGHNEVLQDVGSNCPKCSNYAVVLCLPEQGPKCFCKPGFVRHDVSNKCVKTCECPGVPDVPIPPACPANETWSEHGITCQTCENLNAPCIPLATPGCYCKPGYARNRNNRCVLKRDCRIGLPFICGPNEVQTDCLPACKQTCEDPDNADCCIPFVCHKGCECREGFVRDGGEGGPCVKAENCPSVPPPKCCKHEVLLSSGSNCPQCSNYQIVKCAPENKTQCYCEPGYVRHDVSQACVATTSCPGVPGKPLPPPCSVNETLADSGYDCQTCALQTVKCAEEKKKKCYCKPGYVRNKDLDCIKREECPPQEPPLICGNNEEPSKCVNPCAPTCEEPNPPTCNFLVCNKGCVCRPGYIRDLETKACVKEQFCSKNCKKKNAVYSNCASLCPRSCQSISKPPVPCALVCVDGCVCEKGLILNEVTGICIPEKDCPKPCSNSTRNNK